MPALVSWGFRAVPMLDRSQYLFFSMCAAALLLTGCTHPQPGEHKPFPYVDETYGPTATATPQATPDNHGWIDMKLPDGCSPTSATLVASVGDDSRKYWSVACSNGHAYWKVTDGE